METLIKKIDENNIDSEIIEEMAKLLRDGKTVIFPTETVYGLGANALDEEAAKKIYEAKGRPSDNPLIVHIAEKKEIYSLVESVNEKAEKLINEFWPGPLTVILPKKDIIPDVTSGGLETVAVRMPSNKIANALIKAAGIPIAAPSANISGRPSPTRAEHVKKEMTGRVSGIIMGGDCCFGLESTVVDLTGETPMILRPGSITKEMMEEIVGNVDMDSSLLKKEDNIKAKAPGMKYTHYSPKADVFIIRGEKENIIRKINELYEEKSDENQKIGVICMSDIARKIKTDEIIDLGDTYEKVAANLFDSLIQMDEKGADIVYAESFSTDGVGQAIMNRLMKSAGYKVIEAE